jgi:hypothetical protein
MGVPVVGLPTAKHASCRNGNQIRTEMTERSVMISHELHTCEKRRQIGRFALSKALGHANFSATFSNFIQS